MAAQFHPLPLEVFPEAARPYIARFNREVRDVFALEGMLKAPTGVRRSDLTIARKGQPQVDLTRVSPALAAVVSGSSTVVGQPALTFGLTNTVGTTTTAVSVNSSLALFGLSLPAALALTAATGSSAFAANADHAHLFPTSLRSTANAKTLLLTDDGTDLTLTGSLGTLNINPTGDLALTPIGNTKQVRIASSFGHDTGVYITNAGTTQDDTAAITLNNPIGSATLFTTTAAHPTVPSTCGFFTDLANGFSIIDGAHINFRFNLVNYRFGINIAPLYEVHVFRPSPITFAGQVTTDAGSEYIEYAGLSSGGAIVASSRIQRDTSNSSWDLDLYGSNWAGALTKGLSVIGATTVQIFTKLTLSAINVATDTTTGTKIGTATTQKLGFWNKAPVVQPAAYTVTNPTTDRAFDETSTTVAEIANVLGTLITDLQSIGLVG